MPECRGRESLRSFLLSAGPFCHSKNYLAVLQGNSAWQEGVLAVLCTAVAQNTQPQQPDQPSLSVFSAMTDNSSRGWKTSTHIFFTKAPVSTQQLANNYDHLLNWETY